jgi:GTP cyclohydrolase I
VTVTNHHPAAAVNDWHAPIDRIDHAADAVAALLGAFDIPIDAHTTGTPTRVARAWAHQLSGYTSDPGDHLERTFPAPDIPGPVVVAGIRLASTCAHHLLPFTGTATVAYQPPPGAPIVGLSKLARVVDGYARRLQIQERLAVQVADAVMGRLEPEWVCVVLTAEHACMSVRGVSDPGTRTTTRTLRGAAMADAEVAMVMAAHWEAGRNLR